MGILDYLFMVNGEMSAPKVSSIGLALFACILMFATRRLYNERNRLEDDIFRHTQEIESVQTTLVQRTTITLDGLHGISEYVNESKGASTERIVLGILTSKFEFKSDFIDEARKFIEDRKKDKERMKTELGNAREKLDGAKSRVKILEQEEKNLQVEIRENQHQEERTKEIVKQFD